MECFHQGAGVITIFKKESLSFCFLKVWGRPNSRKALCGILGKNWSLGVPIRQVCVLLQTRIVNISPTIILHLLNPIQQFEFQTNAASCIACDDELLVVGGAGEVLP